MRAALSGRTRAVAIAAALVSAIASILVFPTSGGARRALAQPGGAGTTADVVVDFADGRVQVARVGLPQTPIPTGLTLLGGSGLAVTRNGGMVCAIQGVGCPADDCFCACRDPQKACAYWAYHLGRPDGGWDVAQTGPADRKVAAGAADGWVWGGDRPPVTATLAMRGTLVGVEWLRRHQTARGGIADHVGFTTEAVLAARGAGVDPAGWRTGGHSLADFIAGAAGPYAAGSAAQAGKALAGAAAAGLDPRAAGGVDLVNRVAARFDPVSGWYGPSTWDQSWSILGLAAAGEPIPAPAMDALAGARSPAGGWGAGVRDAEADADSTGLALQALAAAGTPVTATAVTAGLAFLEATQQADAGWGHHGASNVNSTAYALLGLLAAGADPLGPAWRQDGGGGADARDPVGFLLATQRPDGRLGYDDYPSDLVATLQALPALAGRPLAQPGAAGVIDRGARWIEGRRAPDGGFEGFNPGATIDAVLALAAAGRDPAVSVPAGGATPRDFLAAAAGGYAARGPSAAGKLLVGIAALGARPHDFGGVDVVGALHATFDDQTGRFGAGGTWDQAWAILGLRSTMGASRLPPEVARVLVDGAAAGGGWGFEAGAAAADVDSTGLALQALAAAGVPASDPAVRGGFAYLWRAQRPDGGFPGYDGSTSASSTALAIGALAAYGHAVDGPGWMRGPAGGLARSAPRDALLGLRRPSGAFAATHGGGDDPMATYAAVLGLAARPLPIRPAGARVFLPSVNRNR